MLLLNHPDLGKIYFTISMRQPDWGSGDHEISPYEKPVPYDMFSFASAFRDSHLGTSTRVQYPLLKTTSDGGYCALELYYDSGADSVEVRYIFRKGNQVYTSTVVMTYHFPYEDLDSRKFFVFIIHVNRYNYMGINANIETILEECQTSIYFSINACIRMDGTYYPQSSTYPNGYWDYDDNGASAAISALPLCGLAPNSGSVERRRDEQAEYVGLLYSRYSGYGNFSFAYNSYEAAPGGGELDPDPEPPWDPSQPDPNDDDPGGNSKPGGGGGSHDITSDPIIPPGVPDPSIFYGNAFVTLYEITVPQLNTLASRLSSTSIADIVRNIFNSIFDMICGIHILPYSPTLSGLYYNLVIGGSPLDFIELPTLAQQFEVIDCGTISIDEYWGSCFDYSPFTKIKLFLPYVGYVDLDVDEVMGYNIQVKYTCDSLSGACVAFVIRQRGTELPSLIGQYSGKVSVDIPYNTASYESMIRSIVTFAATSISVASIAASGAAAGAAAAMAPASGGTALAQLSLPGPVDLTGAMKEGMVGALQSPAGKIAKGAAGAAAVNTVMSSKPDIKKGGAISDSSGLMGYQKPYIIREIPRQSLPENYKSFRGYPSNVSGTLSQFSGYAEVDDIQLNNIPACQTEIAEIYDLLKGGILL